MSDNVSKPRSNCLSSRQMARLLKKVSLHEGDVVLIRQDKWEEREIMDLLKKAVEHLNFKKVFVAIVDDFDDIRVLNRQEMANFGWHHIDDINKLTGRIARK